MALTNKEFEGDVASCKEPTRSCVSAWSNEKAKAGLPHPAKKRQKKRSTLLVLAQEKPERVFHPANKAYLHPRIYSHLVDHRCTTALPAMSACSPHTSMHMVFDEQC